MPDINTYTDEQTLQLIQDLVGMPYSDQLISLLQKLTGRPIRPIFWGALVTADYCRGRLNLRLGECNTVNSVDFG